MADKRTDERDERKLGRRGDGIGITLPIELVRQLGWRMKQKVTVRRFGKNRLVVEDWKSGK